MTGPRSEPVQPHRTRARRLLPFLTAIILSPLACTEQPTEPQSPGTEPTAAATRSHPYLASKSGQTAAMRINAGQMSLSNSALKVTAANLATLSGPKVLILSDVDGASTTALANSIVSAGFHVGIVRAPEFNWFGSNPAVDGYDAVIHLNGFTYNLPLAAGAQSALRTFVNDGGGFVAAQWNGYEELVGQQTGMPELTLLGVGDGNSDSCGPCSVTYSVVSGQESHPLAAGLPGSFSVFADGHDASLKPGSEASTLVVMTSPSGGPAVLAREFGAGKVVNFSFAPNYADFPADRKTLEDGNVQQLYVNAVRWSSGSQGTPGAGTLDSDADGVIDGSDNCAASFNPAQLDRDADGLGDDCDSDADGDGVLNDEDNCEEYNPDQADENGNWIGDACEDVQTEAQTITFNPLPNRTILDAAFPVSATASSGLTVTFLSSGTCSISGTTVTVTAVGTCTLFAQQAGNAQYAPAQTVQQSFSVTKAPASLSVGTEFIYDGTVKQAIVSSSPANLPGVTVVYTQSGFPVSNPVNAGVYQVVATLDNATYEAAPANGTLTILPATPVITWATPAAVTFGTPLSSTQLNATAAISGSFVYLPAAGTVLQVGDRPISVELIPASSNYARAIKTVTLTVLPADVPPSRLKFNGFFRPVHNLPLVNTVSAGQTVPVKFSVEGGQGSSVLQSGSPSSVPVVCRAGSRTKEVEQTLDEQSSRLQVLGNTYTYAWKTDRDWAGSCRKLIVTLVDGSKHEAVFRFGKAQKPKPSKAVKKGKNKHSRDDD